MVLGKHILPNKRAELLGLAAPFGTKMMTFRDAEMNIELELGLDSTSQDIEAINNLLGATVNLVGETGAKRGLDVSDAVKAGAVLGSASLGTGVAIAAGVVVLVSILNKMGVFGDKATWDAEAVSNAYKRMTSKDEPHSVATYMGRIGSQLPTSNFQDDRLQFCLNQMFIILTYYRAFWKDERNKGWKSNISEINTQKMYDKFSEFFDKFLNKVKSLGVVYEVRMMPYTIRLADPKWGFFQMFGGYGVADIEYEIPMVTLVRKAEAKNAIIPLDDFLFPERESADLLVASWSDMATRQKLIEAGTKINYATLPMGYYPIVTKDRNGNTLVNNIKMTDDDHDDNTRDEIVNKNIRLVLDDLKDALRKYYNNDTSVSLEQIKELLGKFQHNDKVAAYKSLALPFEKYREKEELHCWIKNIHSALLGEIAKTYSVYDLNVFRRDETNPIKKYFQAPCGATVVAVPATPNTSEALLPSVPTPPSGGNGNTPSVPAKPNTGGALLPSELTPPSNGNGNTPSVPAKPNTGGALLPSELTPPSNGNGNTPSVPAKPNTGGALFPSVPTPPSGVSETTNTETIKVKKSGFPWWLLLIPFGLWAMSDGNNKNKNEK